MGSVSYGLECTVSFRVYAQFWTACIPFWPQGFSQAPVLPPSGQVIIDVGGQIMLGRATTYQVGRPHYFVGTEPTLTL